MQRPRFPNQLWLNTDERDFGWDVLHRLVSRGFVDKVNPRLSTSPCWYIRSAETLSTERAVHFAFSVVPVGQLPLTLDSSGEK